MSHYHDSDDLKALGEFKKLAPAEFKGFVELDSIVGRDDGKIPRKYRELIAIAVACTTQCPYCLDVHTRNDKAAGAAGGSPESALLSAPQGRAAATPRAAAPPKLFDRAWPPSPLSAIPDPVPRRPSHGRPRGLGRSWSVRE